MGDLITGIVGISGVLLGLFADRILQRFGKVRCEIEPLKLTPTDGGTRYSLNVKLFNEKEVKTGLRDVVIVFDGKHHIERTMLDRTTWRDPTKNLQTMDQLEVVNLPSREWVTLSLRFTNSMEDARKLAECDKAWFRGYFPDGRRFNERIPFD